MAERLFKRKRRQIVSGRGNTPQSSYAVTVLVGAYKDKQFAWIKRHGIYNYPVKEGDEFDEKAFASIKELWLYADVKGTRHVFEAEFVGKMTRAEFRAANPTYAKLGPSKNKAYYVFKTTFLEYGSRLDDPIVIARTADFGGHSAKVKKAIEQFKADGEFAPLEHYIPSDLAKIPRDCLRVCEAAVQLNLFNWNAPESLITDKSIGNDIILPGANLLGITSAEVLRRLKISRRNLERCIEKGWLVKAKDGEGIEEASMLAFQQTAEYDALLNGSVDERNSLNDLTGKEWIPATKSYMFQKGLGASHPHAQIEIQHPAPFSFQDIESLIEFFTKRGMSVLDPFGGVGSTAKACALLGRNCTSIELSRKYHDLSIERLETEVGLGASAHHSFINGDSCVELPKIIGNTFDFVVTSPPYWGILHKHDQKVLRNRVANNLDTQYSESTRDLGNVADYSEFLTILCDKVFLQCARILRKNKYMALVVSDFRDKGDFISFHSDLIYLLNKRQIQGGGVLVLQGIKILIQNHKSLHPYGYPFSYVENIHHQYILIFRKR